SEQEVVRRDSLQKIKDLGVNPVPAAAVTVNFKTTEFTSADFFANLVKEIEKLKGIGAIKAKQAAEILTKNKFKYAALLEADLGLSEAIEFDAGVTHSATTLEEFVGWIESCCFGRLPPRSFSRSVHCREIHGTERSFCQIARLGRSDAIVH
ncbi:MAG: hypothetical protein AAGJ18_19705, partial [Bacteroidota bacterium]